MRPTIEPVNAATTGRAISSVFLALIGDRLIDGAGFDFLWQVSTGSPVMAHRW